MDLWKMMAGTGLRENLHRLIQTRTKIVILIC